MLNKQLEFGKLRTIFFFGLMAILSIAIIYIIGSFIYPIFWAGILAIIFYPIYNKFLKLIKSPAISSIFTITAVVIILFLPLTLITGLLVTESYGLYQSVSEGNFISSVQGGVANWLHNTAVEPYFEAVKNNWTSYAQKGAEALSVFIFNNLKALTQNSVTFVFMLFITLYTLFFFLKDGPAMLKRLMKLSPLGDEYENMLYNRFNSTVRATLKSTFLIGGIQGALTGLLFWVVGIKGALIWGVLTAAICVVPAFGSFLVWLPAGVALIVLGSVWQGIIVLVFGTVVIATIDNFLRPMLIGKDIQMHPLMVLFSTLGGLAIFGIAGFIIGPVIMAMFMSIMSIYEHHYKKELQNN